jgi:hypothetical protein
LVAAVVWCATAGITGIVLLAAGGYRPIVVGGIATLVAAAAAIATARGLSPREHADHGAALVAVGLVVMFFAGAGVFHSEHLLLDRDPAVYIINGRSIARTHELRPRSHVGPFAVPAFGNPETTDGPGFFPMLSVLLALGWSVGGDPGLLLVGPLLGALGLLACYALASRVLGTRLALLVLAFSMLAPFQLWFARDAYSELVVQVVVLGGMWLFLEARARDRWRIAALAGGLVASSAFARIDALAILGGALAVAAVEWVRCDSDATPTGARRVVAAFASTLLGVTLVALAITNHIVRRYIDSLGPEYRQLVGAFALAVVGLVAVTVIHRVRPGIGRWFTEKRASFVTAVVVGTAAFAWAYIARPDPTSDRPFVAAGRPLSDALRMAVYNWHFSRSLHWFSAYYGLVGLIVAFAGFVILAARARRADGAAATVFLVVIPVAILYLARPSIQPGQPWAMRRYLPVVLPGIAIAVVVALVAGWDVARAVVGTFARRAATAVTAAIALLVVVPTAVAAVPFAHARMQHGAEAAVHGICNVAGHDGAVLVYGGHYLDLELPQVIRAFCGVPTANSYSVDFPQLARQWHDVGRRLLVATAVPRAVLDRAPGAAIVGHYVISDDDDPERVFDRAPKRFQPNPTEIWLLQIPAPAGQIRAPAG